MISLLFLGLLIPVGLALPADPPPSSLKASFGSYTVCKSIATACGLPPETGYTASLSPNHFVSSNGTFACGQCYEVTAETDSKGVKLVKQLPPITVMIDDACPGTSSVPAPLLSKLIRAPPESTTTCSPLLTDTAAKNSLGVSAHFDLCADSGASAPWFGENGETAENLVGMARAVDCKRWKGSVFGDPATMGGEALGQFVS